MGVSALQEQRDAILAAVKRITKGDWKVLVLDEGSKKIIDNVVREDDILNENIANIEMIEDKRPPNPDMDAIYILSPQSYIVDCLMGDIEKRRYRQSFLVWTALLDPQLRRRIDSLPAAKQLIPHSETLSIDYFPRESHLITFRDPWSFPILYHPSCNNLVRDHMQNLAQKILGVCVLLGEYPKVRYYRPRNPLHEAAVLCQHLARFVQEELDAYAQWNTDFPPPSNRPPAVLIITDRSMDLIAPVIHEFTYQAMAHDLLTIKESEKVLYKTIVNEGTPEAKEKEVEIGEKDKIWVENRHRHMKDTIEKLMGDFQKFMAENPHFTNKEKSANSLNAIKDMLAGLPQFQELKEAYSLHLTMAQECMNIFQQHKLPDVASVEQTLATGLDEDYKKPKNIAEEVVRLLDDESITAPERLRLITLYVLYKDGLIPDDIQRLLAHAGLPPQDAEIITNLDLLGARTTRPLKDNKPPPQPIFGRQTVPTAQSDEYALSRYEPNLRLLLDEASRGSLDPNLFPYTKPPMSGPGEEMAPTSGSLRSAKPTWARNRMSTIDSRQRILVFMAGGATYSEARSCYEVSAKGAKDVMLMSSHMVTPSLFNRQVADLSKDRRRLDLPADRAPRKAPDHVFEKVMPPQPRPQPVQRIASGGAPPPGGMGRPMAPQGQMGMPAAPRPGPGGPPTAAMGAMSLNAPTNGAAMNGAPNGQAIPPPAPAGKPEKEKKKRGFFGSKKKD